MTTPTEYLEQCRLVLIAAPVIRSYEIIESWADDRRGYLRVRADLGNGDFLELAEYFTFENGEIVIEDYRYQWMDANKRLLRRRWDNTPHFPGLAGFPDHIHIGPDDSVQPGEAMQIARLVAILNDLIQSTG